MPIYEYQCQDCNTKFEKLVREQRMGDYAEIARLGEVSRARLSQIVSLLNLAPAIQETVLFFAYRGCIGIHRLQAQLPCDLFLSTLHRLQRSQGVRGCCRTTSGV